MIVAAERAEFCFTFKWHHSFCLSSDYDRAKDTKDNVRHENHVRGEGGEEQSPGTHHTKTPTKEQRHHENLRKTHNKMNKKNNNLKENENLNDNYNGNNHQHFRSREMHHNLYFEKFAFTRNRIEVENGKEKNTETNDNETADDRKSTEKKNYNKNSKEKEEYEAGDVNGTQKAPFDVDVEAPTVRIGYLRCDGQAKVANMEITRITTHTTSTKSWTTKTNANTNSVNTKTSTIATYSMSLAWKPKATNATFWNWMTSAMASIRWNTEIRTTPRMKSASSSYFCDY